MRRFRSSRRAAGNTKQPRDPESGTPEIFARAGFGRPPRPHDGSAGTGAAPHSPLSAATDVRERMNAIVSASSDTNLSKSSL